ncbi:MAG: hypothetical protein ACXW2I_13705, partial [Burkholderiales bacterium]
LPRPLLSRLRSYWKSDRPSCSTSYLFVGDGGAPLHETTLQKTFTAARQDAAIKKHATIHTLRHYAERLIMPSCLLRLEDLAGIRLFSTVLLGIIPAS